MGAPELTQSKIKVSLLTLFLMFQGLKITIYNDPSKTGECLVSCSNHKYYQDTTLQSSGTTDMEGKGLPSHRLLVHLIIIEIRLNHCNHLAVIP